MELIVSKYSKQIQFKQANKVMKIEMKNSFRNPEETLRILDALQTGELCACNRTIGGETL